MHIHGIKEMPAGYDAEVAELFRDLRAASGMSETDLAAQLATRLEVVQALEQGAIYALPPWPETCRVISTYGTLLNLDVRPLLRRIYAQVEAGIVELAPKPMPDVPVMPPPQNGFHDPGQRQPGPRLSESSPRQSEPFPASPRAPEPQRPWQGSQGRRQGPEGEAQQSRPRPQSFPQGAPPRVMTPPPQPAQPKAQPAPQGLRVEPPGRAQPKALPPPQARSAAPPAPAPAPARAKPAKQAPQAQQAVPQPAKKRGRGLLKWGILLLLASAAAFGLWMWFSQAGPSGFSLPGGKSGTEAPPPPAASTDPSDPRSRKGDRLPSPPS